MGSPGICIRVKTHCDLDVWKLAMELAERAYAATRSLPKEELYGLTSQIRRSAVSIAANIAEGAGRNTRGEFAQFLGIANGSRSELATLLLLAGRIYPETCFQSEIEATGRVGMMLTKLRRSVRLHPT